MKKIFVIEACKKCSCLDDAWGLLNPKTGKVVAQIGKYFCTHSKGQRMCDNINIIPDWCPLPETKTVKVAMAEDCTEPIIIEISEAIPEDAGYDDFTDSESEKILNAFKASLPRATIRRLVDKMDDICFVDDDEI